MEKAMQSLFAMILAASLFAGCGGGGTAGPSQAPESAPQPQSEASKPQSKAAEDKPVKLTFTGIGFNLKNGVDPASGKEFIGWEQYAGTDFKAAFPNVELKVETIPWDNFKPKMQTILQSGGTDLLYASGSFTAAFHKDGLLQGLNQFMENDPEFVFEDVYPAGLRKNMNLTDYTADELVALPYILGYRINIYDKQLFDDWGVEYLSERPTIEEILEKAAKMTGTNPKTGKQNYGVFFYGKTPNMSTMLSVGYQNGVVGCEGTLNDLKGLKWSVNSPELEKTVTQMCELSKYCPPSFVNDAGMENFGTAGNDIAIGLDVSGGKIMNEFNNSGDQSLLDRYVPVYGLGKQGEGWAVADGIAMSGSIDEDKKDTAWQVMKYLAGPEASKWYYDQFGPLSMAVKDDSFYQAEDKYIKMNAKVIENSHSGLFEELNPFFASDIQPTLAGLISRAATGETIDVAGELQKLQAKAENWSANQ